MPKRARTSLLALCVLLGGCAGGVKQYILQTRSHQGDVALANGSLSDAALAYRLALQFDPDDAHARAGLGAVQIRIAVKYYQTAKYDDALVALAVAQKYDPQSVRVAEVRSEVEQARTNRAIVVSNYPTYSETGKQIRRAYVDLKTLNAKIIVALEHFDYTYDAAQLTAAIRSSYELSGEVERNTSRLIAYRQLVEAGSPSAAAGEALSPAASLLPLP